MSVDPQLIRLLQQLSDAPGAPGFEDAVVGIAREVAAPFGTLQEDFLRNLYIHRKENTGTKPVLMLDAHSDEVGYLIQSILPNGCLRFVKLGFWNPETLPGQKVRVRNALGEYISGVISANSPHHMARSAEQELLIDVGACSYDEAVQQLHLRIGEPAVPATRFCYDPEHDLCHGKAFDCRMGCAALLEVLRRLEGKELACDVVGVLSSQEELLERGCAAAVQRVQPRIAIVLEGCPADDTLCPPYTVQTGLRRGPMLRHMDAKVICSPRFQRWALELAHSQDLAVQEAVRESGGNNAAVIQTLAGGAPSIVVGVPVRYIHAPHGIATGFDLEAAVRLVCALIEQITPQMIEAL